MKLMMKMRKSKKSWMKICTHTMSMLLNMKANTLKIFNLDIYPNKMKLKKKSNNMLQVESKRDKMGCMR